MPLSTPIEPEGLLDAPLATNREAANCATSEFDWLPPVRSRPDFNDPFPQADEPFDPHWTGHSIFDLVRRVAERQPDRIAVSDGARRLTYRGLLACAVRLAGRIAAAIEPGAPVAILLPNDVSYPAALLGCFAAGCPCIALDRDYPHDRNRAIVEHSGAAAVVLSPAETWSGAAAAIWLDVVEAEAGALAPRNPPGGPDDPAVIVYTSGSTGQPKGIALSQRALLHRAGQLIGSLRLGLGDRTLPLGSPCTVAGLLQTFEALLAGATLIKVNVRTAGIGGVLDAIAREGVTAVFATPALLRGLCRSGGARAKLASVRCVHPSGEVLLSADVKLLRQVIPEECSILTAYGLTEAPAICQWFVPRDELTPGRVPVGYPVSGYDRAIVDDDDRPVAAGATGELVVRSRYTALGEWRDGKVVPGFVLADPGDPALRVVHTGDLVRQRSDGLLTVIGRKDRQIQIRGMRVEPFEIECALRGCASVADAAVVSREDAGETSLTAFVVFAAPTDAGADAIEAVRRHLAQALPSHMRPSRIISLDRLPLLPGYKIDNDALRALSRSPAQSAPRFGQDIAAGDDARAAIEAAWCGVLDRDSLERGATFAEAGGDSLRLLTLVFDAERRLGVTLPLADFDHDMTACQMMLVVRAALAAAPVVRAPSHPESSMAVLLKSGTLAPPVFIAHGLGGHVGEVSAVGKHLGGDRPVFALQAAGLHGGAVAADVEGFAAQHVAAITEIQPHGPYVLIGYSLGGLLLLEAARMLQRRGERIAFLALLESYPHRRFWPLRPWLGLLGERAQHHLAALRRARPREGAARLVSLSRSVIAHLGARLGVTPQPLVKHWNAGSPGLRAVRRGLVTAEARFRVQRYTGDIAFFKPEVRRWEFPADPLSVWRDLADHLEVITVPGSHLTMCTDHAEALAASLDRRIERALAAA